MLQLVELRRTPVVGLANHRVAVCSKAVQLRTLAPWPHKADPDSSSHRCGISVVADSSSCLILEQNHALRENSLKTPTKTFVFVFCCSCSGVNLL